MSSGDVVEESASAPPVGDLRQVGVRSVRWSAGAVLGRQASQIVAALVLARVLGPQQYGVISAATVYVTLTTLLLDQGLAAALVQRPALTPRTPGAVATANLVFALLFAALTWVAAPWIAAFFRADALAGLVRVLGLGLILKAAAITPRAMNQRRLRFHVIGVADIVGGAAGSAAGIVAALEGAGTWALAVQVLLTDIAVAVVLLARTRGTKPNLALAELLTVLPFSLRIFGSNGLAYLSRNLDNVLVGRVLGVSALSLYSMAYRVLVIPVQMVGQTTNRVTFPLLSRLSSDRAALRATVARTTELLAFMAIPAMGLIAVASPELVLLVLGGKWSATAPVLTILCVAGARETVFSVTQSLMRAAGAGRLVLRYEVLAACVQLSGIVVGLQFGLIGVALGVTVAGFALSPVMLLIQRRLAGVRIRSQLMLIAAPAHAAVWGAAGYVGIGHLVAWVDGGNLLKALVGTLAYVLIAFVVLLVAHRPAARRALVAGRALVSRRTPGSTVQKPANQGLPHS